MVSIPQAVSAVATEDMEVSVIRSSVSIPQAVSAVATQISIRIWVGIHIVSIPQAVSAVATAGSRKPVFKRFQKVVLENLKP